MKESIKICTGCDTDGKLFRQAVLDKMPIRPFLCQEHYKKMIEKVTDPQKRQAIEEYTKISKAQEKEHEKRENRYAGPMDNRPTDKLNRKEWSEKTRTPEQMAADRFHGVDLYNYE